METQQILRELERATASFPRAAVEAAIMRRDKITPELLRVLRETTERAVELDAEEDYAAHIYAMFLLAQFREVQAYPLIVEFASLPGDLLESLCGDFISEDLGRILASVCGGDLGGIQFLIENEAVGQWVRAAALSSLVTLVAAGQKSREDIVGYFGQLFRGKLVRRFSIVWNELVSSSADLYPAELLEDIREAYLDDLIDPVYIGWADVKEDWAAGKDRALARLADDNHYRLVEDTVQEMEWWACFHPHEPRTAPSPPPFKPAKPKVGRNKPCPCGSGRKFKNCCGI